MKLSKITHLAVKGLPKEAKERLATALGLSLNRVYSLIRDNESDSDLTKATAIEFISGETNIPLDQVLIDESKESNGLEVEAKLMS